MATRLDLGRQIALGLWVYGVLLSAALLVHGLLVNEQAERMAWEAMLETAMDDLLDRRAHQEDFVWRNNGKLDFYRIDTGTQVPERLRGLSAGLHDELEFNDNEWVVLVRQVGSERIALAMDIDGFENLEWQLLKPVVMSAVLFMLLLGVLIHFGVRLLVRPLRDMARYIGSLLPDRRGQRVALPQRASLELEVIAGALNGYLERNDRFVERERVFVDTASHELRTPVSVIRSAVQLALLVPEVPQAATWQLQRIDRTTREVEELVSMLLVLAKDPARMRQADERVALHELLPEIIEDHRPLCRGKALELVCERLPACILMAPESVLRVAISNLLRNAIEHSDQGEIRIALDARGGVEIRDPGHGMTPAQIAELYSNMARGGGHRAGIGLALIARLSEHLGWHLDIHSGPETGTRVRLDLSASRVE